MPLIKRVLLNGFRKAKNKMQRRQEGVVKSIKSRRGNVGKGVSQEAFRKESQKMRESTLGSSHEDLIRMYGKTIAKYLNGMQDPTGEGPIPAFSLRGANPTEPLARALIQTPNDKLSVAPCDSLFKGTWGSYFNLKFKMNVPPPGGKKEILSQGLPVPIGSLAGVMTPSQTYDSMINKYASLIHNAATSIPVKIDYLDLNDVPKTIMGTVS
jgi:hypothetical protein